MIKDGKGGGNTRTGLIFEGKTDLATFLSKQDGYRVVGCDVFYKNEIVARIFKKRKFYSVLLKELDINWDDYISKQLFPDDSIFVIVHNTIFIIECKYQQVGGSVDEKLATCDFKKKEYEKLLSKANLTVEYIYLLDDWFKEPKYRDILDYIRSVNCDYYFGYIPLEKFGLPIPEQEKKDV